MAVQTAECANMFVNVCQHHCNLLGWKRCGEIAPALNSKYANSYVPGFHKTFEHVTPCPTYNAHDNKTSMPKKTAMAQV